MRFVVSWISLVLVLAMVVPAFAAGDKKQKGGAATSATPADYSLLQEVGTASGRVTDFNSDLHQLTLEVDITFLQANGSNGKGNSLAQAELKKEQEIEKAELKIMQSRTPKEAAKARQELDAKLQHPLKVQGSGKGSVKTKTEHKTFDLTTQDNVKVRLAELPIRQDVKGKNKPYTPQELRDAKGPNKKLPGYTASLTDLQVGQTILVYVVPRKKDAAKEKVVPDKNGDAPKDKVTANTPEITMIVILPDAPAQGTSAVKGSKP